MTADAAAMAELWRSAMALGSSGIGVPGLEATGIANDTIGKMLDPVSMSLMGGNRVGEAIRRMTEGPRFADVGSIERDMAQVMELYLEVQASARRYEGVVAQAWVEVNQQLCGGGVEAFHQRPDTAAGQRRPEGLAGHRQRHLDADPSLNPLSRGAKAASPRRHGLPSGGAEAGRTVGRAGRAADAY